MSTETLLVRTMSDTVETDIHRVLTIANELLPRYDLAPLSFEQHLLHFVHVAQARPRQRQQDQRHQRQPGAQAEREAPLHSFQR